MNVESPMTLSELERLAAEAVEAAQKYPGTPADLDAECEVKNAISPKQIAALVKAAKALVAAHVHTQELRDAWQRGAIQECDGKGGTRSNRNMDVEVQARAALQSLREAGIQESEGE